MSKAKWPEELPVCEYITCGLVTITGVDTELIYTFGRHVPVVDIRADTIYSKHWNIAPYACKAWLEDLKPLTRAAREMIAIAKAGAR